MRKRTAKQIASTVSGSSFNHKIAPGVAQKVILDALNIEAESFGHANAIFSALGISVIPQRKGRKSVPTVQIVRDFSYDGVDEYSDYSAADYVDLSAIKEWTING